MGSPGPASCSSVPEPRLRASRASPRRITTSWIKLVPGSSVQVEYFWWREDRNKGTDGTEKNSRLILNKCINLIKKTGNNKRVNFFQQDYL